MGLVGSEGLGWGAAQVSRGLNFHRLRGDLRVGSQPSKYGFDL